MAKSVAGRVILCLSVLRQTSEMLRACVHAKSIQSYPTLCDPMSCTPPDSSAHGIIQARITGVGCRALLRGILLTRGLNLRLLHRRQILYCRATGQAPEALLCFIVSQFQSDLV